jgi:cob(I)alamin adenosyltransferase
MARIYTRTGDGGETSLLGGRRTPKSDPRVDLYGHLDELNSALGLAAALAARPVPPARAEAGGDPSAAAGPDLRRLPELLKQIATWQSQLFDLGALLADPERSSRLATAGDETLAARVAELESAIDRFESDLPPLRNFILPGGGEAAAAMHLARAVCRRAERRAVEIRAEVPFPAAVVAYLNRLGDLLFVSARWIGRLRAEPETVWRPAPEPGPRHE